MSNLDLSADIIDVRDIIARFEELESEMESFVSESDDPKQDWIEAHPDDASELASLESLLADLSGNGGDEQWRGNWYPMTLIRESHFEAAMDEMLEDCGDLPKNLPSYLSITVDYGALKMDYTSCEIEGADYWYR